MQKKVAHDFRYDPRILFTMHGQYNIKFISAQQTKQTYKHKNIKEKLYKCKAAIWYNKSCRQLTPSYITINQKVHLVGSIIYFIMMQGQYDIKFKNKL